MKNFIAYYRVSTTKQGNSGLGLEGQKIAVKNFIGGNNLLQEFTEIESGKNDSRIELQKAMAAAKQHGATLVIAKLDRLSRNAAFIFALRDSGVDFVCCDMPDANSFTIGIFALIAQQEREQISSRTKAALQAKKAQGHKLGSPANLTAAARTAGNEAYSAAARSNEFNVRAFAMIKVLRQQGQSYRTIAETLNTAGFKTAKGKEFFAISVQRVEQLFS